MTKALIIIDIQNDYFENGAMELVDAEKAAKNARRMLRQFRKEKIPVVHIQHVSNKTGATFFIPDTKGVAIHEEVIPLAGEKIITKHYPNGFRETELLEYLSSLNITDLVICGMMTHMCVDSTTRAAKDLGYNCIVIGDACATKDLEVNGSKVRAGKVQISFLSALTHFYATIKTTKQYLNEQFRKDNH